jgi:tetratricopeptide (TPR) repeat protein
MVERLVVVGWEVADWDVLHRLIDQGELPTLGKLIDAGSSGDLSSPPPSALASQWTTIATGKRAWQHQVCLPYHGPEATRRLVTAPHRAEPAFWEILSTHALRTVSVGWPASHGGAINGALVSDHFHLPTAPPGQPWPSAAPGTYSPPTLAARLDPRRVNPEEIDAEVLDRYVPEWRSLDARHRPLLAKLRILLATDFSYQAAMSCLMESEEWQCAAIRHMGIGEICRLFGQQYLQTNDSSDKASAAFRQVVPAAYRVLDAMLDHLLQLAGPDTAVILVSPAGLARTTSASGGREDDRWRNAKGIVLMAGKRFGRDQLLHGVNALDIAPTILSWFGVSRGHQLEGRARLNAATSSPETIATFQLEQTSSVSESGRNPARDTLSPVDCQRYDWSMTQSLLNAGRIHQALPILESLVRGFPENPLFSQSLFQTQLSLGMLDEAEETLELLVESLAPTVAPVPRAELALARGERETARQLVLPLTEVLPQSSPTWHRIGLLLLLLREWTTLEKCARSVLAQTERDELAWLGLAEASLRHRDYDTAELAATRAIGLQYFMPDAHLALSRALAGKGLYLAATQVADRLVAMDPKNKVAAIYARRLHDVLGMTGG